MSNVVIVAIPEKNDRVWKVSSEKIPHLTLLHLGDTDKIANLDQLVLFVEHAVNTTLRRFYLSVDRRGELGEDQADVVFFKKNRYDYKAIRDFRSSLLQNSIIKTAYDSSEQFEGPWTPHLTLGYPASPAKKVEDDYLYSVDFDKIAVWIDEYDGPEFELKDHSEDFDMAEIPMDVAMSDLESMKAEEIKPQTADLGAKFLAHYGIKGMRWGVRSHRDVSAQTHVDTGIVRRQTKIQTKGGAAHPAADDAVRAAIQKQKLKKSGTASLSNKELQDLARRLQLELQVETLTSSKGKSFVKKQLGQQGQQQVQKGLSTATTKARKIAIGV